MRLIFALTVAAALLASAASVGATSRADTPPQAALDTLNRIRAENGIPAEITLNQGWSAKCAAHDRYLAQNNVLVHPEDPTKPGYSADGNWAGENSVLAEGGEWGPDSTPWDTAPIHLAQMLGPALTETGIANVGAYSCLTTWPGYERTGASDVIYTDPADSRSGVAASEVASESPFVPGQFVGIPAGSATGPYLYVLPAGPWTTDWFDQPQLVGATLTGPTGPVEVRTIDNTNQNLAGYLPTGSGMVIPVHALKPNATYTASATLSGGGDTLSKTWTFTTQSLDNQVSIDGEPLNGEAKELVVQSTAPDPQLTLTSGGRTLSLPLRKGGGQYTASLASVKLGSYHVCAASGGTGTAYAAASDCADVTIVLPARPAARYVRISITLRGSVATARVMATGPLLGVQARVWFFSGNVCAQTVIECSHLAKQGARRGSLAPSLVLTLPCPPRGVNEVAELTVTVADFVGHDKRRYLGFTRTKTLPSR
jgi:hypothetical protein